MATPMTGYGFPQRKKNHSLNTYPGMACQWAANVSLNPDFLGLKLPSGNYGKSPCSMGKSYK
jgi:hypothetical protein